MALEMKYRVSYPMITDDHFRDFATREEAERFAADKRNRHSPFLTFNSWNRVTISEIDAEATAADDTCVG